MIAFIGAVVNNRDLNMPCNVKEMCKLIVHTADDLIVAAEDRDAEGCFMVLFKDIQLCSDTLLQSELVMQVIGVLEGKTEENAKPYLRLRIMANLCVEANLCIYFKCSSGHKDIHLDTFFYLFHF